jgi:hypothetical protein
MEKQGRKEYFEENREEICSFSEIVGLGKLICKLKQGDAPTIAIIFKS